MASNTFYISLSIISSMALSLIYFIVVGKLLTPSELGIANSTIQFAGLITTFSSLGLTNAALKLVSEYYESKKFRKLYGCIGYCLKLILAANIPISILIFFISPTLATFIFRDPNLTSPFRLSALLTFFLSLTSFFGSVIYGLQKVKIYVITDFIINSTKVLFAVVLILFFSLGFWGPLVGYLLGALFSAMIRFKTIGIKTHGKPDKPNIWFYAFPSLIITILTAILTTTPLLILSSLSSTAEAGIFSLANSLSSLLMFVPNVFYMASFPVFSGLHGKKDKRGIEKLLNSVFRYTLIISIPLSLVFIIYPQFIIRLIARPAYLAGTSTLSVLGIVGSIWGIGNILLNALYALGKPKISRNIMLVTSVMFLILSIPLTMNYASLGMAVAYLIATSFLLLSSLFFTRKFYRLHVDYKHIVKISLSSLLALTFLIFLMRSTNSTYFFIFATLVSFLVYLILLLITRSFDKNDLDILLKLEKMAPKKLSFIFNLLEKLLRKFV
jgi:O-antigen/teichoic acid export membrane protein